MSGWTAREFRVCNSCGQQREVVKGFSSNFFNRSPCSGCGNYDFNVRFTTERDVYEGVLWNLIHLLPAVPLSLALALP